MRFIVWPIRMIAIIVYWFLLTSISSIICLFRFRNKGNLYGISRFVGPLLKPLYGIDAYILTNNKKLPKKAVYISNHQSTMDIVTLSRAMQRDTVTIGKKALAMIPFFGWMYYLSGNILIDKKVATKAFRTIQYVVEQIKTQGLSVWLFPEGTRSYGRYEMAEFKPGAFLTAIEAGVPIVPIVVSDLNKFKIGNLNNGKVIIKYLEPINTKNLNRKQARDLAAYMENIFLHDYRSLNKMIEEQGDLPFTFPKTANFELVDNEIWETENEAFDGSLLEGATARLQALRAAEAKAAKTDAESAAIFQAEQEAKAQAKEEVVDNTIGAMTTPNPLVAISAQTPEEVVAEQEAAPETTSEASEIKKSK